MAENSKIEWTTHTFNHVEGCTKVSAGCAHCYAESQAKRFGRVKWGPESAGGTRRVASESYWHQPVNWNRKAEEAADRFEHFQNGGGTGNAKPPERPRVFCASLADVFEDWQGPMVNSQGCRLWRHEATGNLYPQVHSTDEAMIAAGGRLLTMDDCRSRLFQLIDDTPNLDWLILTKRPENILRMIPPHAYHGCTTGDCPHDNQKDCDPEAYYRDNVWIGTSVEDQLAADTRIPHLLKVKAAVRFLSMEPLLGKVDLGYPETLFPKGPQYCCSGRECGCGGGPCEPPLIYGISWVILGGESGHTSRECSTSWITDVRDQCKQYGFACFIKQLGAKPTWNTLPLIQLNDKKGGDWAEWPEHLRVREFPTPSRRYA